MTDDTIDFIADVEVDAFGLLCPAPIIKTAAAIKNLVEGKTIKVITTDKGAIKDLQDWCRANRHTFLDYHQQQRVIHIWIRKGI